MTSHKGEYNEIFDLTGPTVTDHDYSGNVCTGFGGRYKCWSKYDCTATPHQHYKAKHRKSEWDD